MRSARPFRTVLPFSAKAIAAFALVLCGSAATAQNIAINVTGLAPDASALLDVDGATLAIGAQRGLLIPRVALTSTTATLPIAGTPANSLLVYNTATAGDVTPGYYYWNTTSAAWQQLLTGLKGWSTTGNAGTIPGTNFLGTTDGKDLVFKTGGSAATNERMRVLSGGVVVVNNTTAINGDLFSVYGGGTANAATGAISAIGSSAINGYASGDGTGVFGETVSATTSEGVGLFGLLNALNVPANGSSTSSLGIIGINVAAPLGTAATAGSARGVEGDATGAAGNGLTLGVAGFASSTTGAAIGIYGNVGSSNGNGVFAYNSNNSGTALFTIGQNAGGVTLAAGSGAAFTGKSIGGFGFAETGGSGCGLVGAGNNGGVLTPTKGCGVAGTGKQYGVVGFATTTVNTNAANNATGNGNNASAGGYFEVQNGGAAQTWAYVGVKDDGGILRKIIGPGTVNTIVKDQKGDLVALSCPEAPENLFQDYGSGQLENGKVHVELDPILAMNIVVDEKHPLRVFIQLEGDCNGVYVSNKTGTGFDVVELANGSSSVAFSYTVVANRADEVLADGTVSRYSDERFAPAPGPLESVEQKASSGQSAALVQAQPAAQTHSRKAVKDR